jgi:iron complex outermembrane receptor protein
VEGARTGSASRRGRCARGLAAVAALAATVAAAAESPGKRDLADLSLEELSNIEITSVAKRAERLSDAPASVFVITGEDIRRSGATSLPEALRLAPNLEVARVSSNTYAISARGFNNAIGNKLLVLIDGRTVYSPIFSGVFWDVQDLMLEDVERIEVIDGPGAALWGANAVNGVINVITRPAQSTRGPLLSAGSGNRESDLAARLGGPLGDNGSMRLYAKGFSRNGTRSGNGTELRDAWDRQQAGFRTDWGGADGGFTFQGDAYAGAVIAGAALGSPTVAGSNLLGRWNRQFADGSSFRLQAYYDHAERDDPIQFRDKMDVYDVEFQHAPAFGANHRVLWGGGYRYAQDNTRTSLLVRFIPDDRSLKWWNAFVQDEVSLASSVVLTLGVKVETNVYTGPEYLPSLRLAWKPSADKLVWGALSRAVRAPARIDREFFFPGNPPFFINGGPDFQSEVFDVAELGYRARLAKAASFSMTAFHHIHDKLRSGSAPPAQVHNNAEGTTSGFEGWGNYQATDAWRLSAGFVELRQRLHLKSDSPPDPTAISNLGNDPEHTQMLRSLLNLSERHEFDLVLRHVSALPNPAVPAYTAVDARLGWRARRDTELSLAVQNLFDPRHVEFGAAGTASEIPRSVFLKLLWRP